MPALDGNAVLVQANPLQWLHRSVHLRGRWIGDHTVYLDNRQMRGKPGFYVLTPFRLEGSGVTVMLQRGWIARDFLDRSRLAQVDTPNGLVVVVGRVALPASKLYEIGAVSSGVIRQNLDFAQFRQETGLALETAYSVVQLGAASEGLLREWPVINMGVEKHHGYAVQWFALAVLIVGLFVWFQLRPLFFTSKDCRPHV